MDFLEPVRVPPEYRCPLCPDHRDELYFDGPLFERPICEGCRLELDVFIRQDERPQDNLIDRVEQVTGRPWSECRALLLRGLLDYWEHVQRDRPESWMSMDIEELRHALNQEADEGGKV